MESHQAERAHGLWGKVVGVGFLSLKESTQRGFILHEEGRDRLFSDEWLFSVEG